MKTKLLLIISLLYFPLSLLSSADFFINQIDLDSEDILKKVTVWRQHLHQYPELSNREFNTAKYIEKHLKSLGLEVETGIAKTGLIAILKGTKPGPMVALRADMDALPVVEQTGLPLLQRNAQPLMVWMLV